MADNVLANPGAGPSISTEDIGGGVQLPRGKMVLGAAHVDDGDVSAANPMPVYTGRSTTSSVAQVASSATSVTLLASNANRRGAVVTNDSTQVLYLKLGATASLTSYSYRIPPYGIWELPFNYSGVIDGIWASANGKALVTELTP